LLERMIVRRRAERDSKPKICRMKAKIKTGLYMLLRYQIEAGSSGCRSDAYKRSVNGLDVCDAHGFQ